MLSRYERLYRPTLFIVVYTAYRVQPGYPLHAINDQLTILVTPDDGHDMMRLYAAIYLHVHGIDSWLGYASCPHGLISIIILEAAFVDIQ